MLLLGGIKYIAKMGRLEAIIEILQSKLHCLLQGQISDDAPQAHESSSK